MSQAVRFYSNIPEIVPRSTKKIFKRQKVVREETKTIKTPKNLVTEYRENEFQVQMLSRSLFQQIFKNIEERNAIRDTGQFEK